MKPGFLTLLSLLAVVGCSTRKVPPQVALSSLYQDLAQVDSPERKPVIVIPGILGSKLRDSRTGESVWGGFESRSEKRASGGIALPIDPSLPLSALRDSLVPDGVLESLRVSVAPGLRVEGTAYRAILKALGPGGYRDQDLGEAGAIDYGADHFTCFQFSYDWRRSCAENAALLHEFVLQKKALVERENQKRFGRSGEVRFDLVAHSMGSLIAHYYLRYGNQSLERPSGPALNWKGADLVDNAILVAPPNAGSIQSLLYLLQGFRVAPATPFFSPAVIGTMPGVYELIPRQRHRVLWTDGDAAKTPQDPLELALWDYWDWGLLDESADGVLQTLLPQLDSAEARQAAARDHLRKCLENARRFQESIDRPSRPPAHLRLILFAGDDRPTHAGAAITGHSLRVDEMVPGDGVVPRYSALLDEGFAFRPAANRLQSPVGWTAVHFLQNEHIALTEDFAFTDTLLFLLLQDAPGSGLAPSSVR